MLADMVVIDRNPFKIPVTDIHKVNVKMTIINGEVVYEGGRVTGSPSARSAPPSRRGVTRSPSRRTWSGDG